MHTRRHDGRIEGRFDINILLQSEDMMIELDSFSYSGVPMIDAFLNTKILCNMTLAWIPKVVKMPIQKLYKDRDRDQSFLLDQHCNDAIS